jgi:hypothetical protein
MYGASMGKNAYLALEHVAQTPVLDVKCSSRIAVAERSTNPAVTNAAQDILNLQNARALYPEA